MHMNIISVDSSLSCSGWFLKVNGYETIGTVKNASVCTHSQARTNIYESFKEIIDGKSIDVCFMEGYSFNPRNPVKAAILVEVGGIVKLVMDHAGIPVLVIPPKSWKSHTIGNEIDKSKSKRKYLNAVKEKYNREFKTTDEADAYMIYLAFRKIAKKTKQLKPYEKEIRTALGALIG
jgi:Holliday junction resolvasome RuvABC endonuclease subunit